MTINYKHVTTANLVFCYIPVFLFLCGWCRWLVAVPFSALILLAFYLRYRTTSQLEGPSETLTIDRKVIYGVLGGSALLAFIIGYGGLLIDDRFFTDYVRNGAVVQDLARYPWPVIYTDAPTPSMLTYYLGSYLFPGLIGKIFGSPMIGELALGLIGWIGMVLLFLNILFLVKAKTTKAQVWALLIYLGFYGMLLPLQLLTFWYNKDVILGYPHWFTYPILQYRSTMVSLKWMWPQYTIPVLCLINMYTHSAERKHYALWVLPGLICGVWAFVTLVAYAICAWVVSCVKEKKFQYDIISWQNIVCAIIGLIMLSYLLGCWSVNATGNMKFHLVTDWRFYLLSYWQFCLFMFGIYFLIIWKETEKDDFFYITLFLLCAIPFCRGGVYNDWVMGNSMPALFMMTIYVIRFLINPEVKAKVHKKWLALVICLAINVPFPLFELYNFKWTGMPERTMKVFSDRDNEEIDLGWRTYFTNYEYESSIFYQYFARK